MLESCEMKFRENSQRKPQKPMLVEMYLHAQQAQNTSIGCPSQGLPGEIHKSSMDRQQVLGLFSILEQSVISAYRYGPIRVESTTMPAVSISTNAAYPDAPAR